jgi:hypothetical protein
MMRLRLASLALPVACGCTALAPTAVGAVPAREVPVAHGGRARPVARGVSPRAAASDERRWSLNVSPAPGDLALLEIRFHRTIPGGVSPRSLRVAVAGSFGDDYLAASTPRSRTRGGPRALVLLVNRPSPLNDPAHVALRFAATGALGMPVVSRLADPFTRPPKGSRPALCNLPLSGSPLQGSRLRALSSRGASLVGFGAAGAVAQAYDVVCGLPHAASFEQAVTGRCPLVGAAGTLCCPPNAICAPAPGQPAPAPTPVPTPSPTPTPPPEPHPPAPQPPRCAPCDAPPGFACPAAVFPDVCAAPATSGARRAPARAH